MPANLRLTTAQKELLYPLVVLAVGILSYVPWLGSYGPLDPTDSFFLESAREALETNQLLLPLDNYVPWLDKPILFFWLVEYAFKFFGIHTFIGRLPAALSAIIAGQLIYFGTRPMLKPRTAALAALIFLSTPLSSIVGHVCLTDMTLTALIAGSILFLFKGLEYAKNKDLYIGYFCLGLAMLCKGPIAIIICALALLPYLISTSKSKNEFVQKIRAIKPLLGSLIVLALNLPWYIEASLATNGRFLWEFFIRQNFGRMVGTVNHQEKIYFYIPVFFGGFFPWCALSLSAAGVFKKTFQKKSEENSSFRRLIRLSLFWFFGVIALFTAIKTKLPTYILPSVPAFSILIAMQLELILKSGKLKRMIPALALITLALLVGMAVHPMLKGYVKDIITQNVWVMAPV
ncbi:MAG: glycosyltransferase family 39 protein, partial [Candidatus Obscuribacterales bacterium]|nr:glycosyltransferase family 39 protein [Candidatus Obscuribacterales bacterium]